MEDRGDKKCGYRLIKTEHPKLFFLEDTDEEDTKLKTITPANIDIFAYMNSKFVYVERYIKGQMNKMYYDLIKKQCELERRVITNALSIATISPEEFGYVIMEEPGYLGIVTGEVIHLIKCSQVEVELRPTPGQCFDQLPVRYQNEPYFLAPRSRILVKKGM